MKEKKQKSITDRIRGIEKRLPQALHADRHSVMIEISRIRREISRRRPAGSDDADRQFGRRISAIERGIALSVGIKHRRQQKRPIVDYPPDLPITARREEIVAAISAHPVVIVSGETGSGKTTQLPKFCIEAGRGIEGRIGCTQPRRIAAVTVASRIAEELGISPGEAVGYKIRFKDRVSDDTIIKMMTDGILLAETQGDRYLNEYDTIIVDEAHERSLNIDFLLGLLKQLIQKRRDLKIIITSATIDTEKFSKAFNDAPIIEVSGRMFPVEVRYQPPESVSDDEAVSYVESAVHAVDEVVRKSPRGDILVFMPTERDILESCEMIDGRKYMGTVVLPLFARLPAAEQARVFKPVGGRKIVVATNVAETSITIPGIRYVIDTGLARISQYLPQTRTTALPVSPISKSAADQRMGRCGRMENGICIRLYSEEDYLSRPLYTPPEILRANLAEVILRMIALKLGSIADFAFVDPPPARRINDGFDILFELGAIEKTAGKQHASGTIRLTKIGNVMAKMPMDPRLSRMLIEATRTGCVREVAVIASALTIQDPRERSDKKEGAPPPGHAALNDPMSDFISLYNVWRTCVGDTNARKPVVRAKKLKQFAASYDVSFKRMREWLDVHEQIAAILEESGIEAEAGLKTDRPKADKSPFSDRYTAIHKAILSGFLANIAQKKEKNIYRAAKQREAMIFPGSSLFNRGGEWIVAAEMVETSRLFARTVANIDVRWLEAIGGSQCRSTYSNPRWQLRREAVVADEQVSLFGLIIVSGRPVLYGKIDPQTATDIFIQSALIEGNVKTVLPFMRHNWSLFKSIRDMEDRVRRRDLMVDESAMLEFYRRHLDGVYDIRTLKHRIKKKGSDDFLKMTEADLLAFSPDSAEMARYPDTITIGGVEYRCSYAFNPGAEDDGITISVPASAASGLPLESTDWVVPGLLTEKITGLIKNLPKPYRKQLVPVNDTVAAIMKEMPKYIDSLVGTLSRFIYEKFGVDIPVSQWREDQLPDYLRIRFSLVDQDGKVLVSGRDRRILKGAPTDRLDSKGLAAQRRKWERVKIKTWDFPDLPEMVTVTGEADRNWPVYPGLEVEGDSVSLRLFTNQQKAETAHKKGVARLYALYFSKEIKHVQKSLVLPAAAREAATYFGGQKGIESQIVDRVIADLFEKNIRTEADFFEHAHASVNRLVPAGRVLLEQVLPVMAAYHEARQRLFGLEGKHKSQAGILRFIEEQRNALALLVPEHFIALYDAAKMPHLVRYVTAITLRTERGVVDMDKDRAKADRIAPFTARLNEMIAEIDETASTERRAAVEDFFWMIEEFKVSLFAQELKTPYPVSEKRLQQKYQEITRML